MSKTPVTIRKAIASDSEQLWSLMQKLAIFEKYIDSFAITPDIVRQSGFEKAIPDFYSIVADDNGTIAGMLVYYFLPYTAQNCPAIYMKELYVEEQYRNAKIGEQLMNALKDEAIRNNCRQIRWGIAPWNDGAIKFYQRLGGRENNDWLSYEWNVK